ncbi:MAG: hypothetical protein ACREQW_08515 [Candidatus Binatia bacterium]
MDQDAYDDAQQNREHAREALTQKIELLEERVRGSVDEAKAVVKQKLRFSYHVERRPWQMLGLFVLTGFVIGRAVGRDRARPLYPAEPSAWPESKSLRGQGGPDHNGMSAIKGAAAGIVTSVAVQLFKEGLAAAASKVKTSGLGRRGKLFPHQLEQPATESRGREFR